MLAYTGLETVANLAEEARRPGVDLPRSLFVAIGTVVTLYIAIAVVGALGVPGPGVAARHRLAARAARRRRHRDRRRTCRIRSAACCGSSSASSGALILVAAVTTSISGFSRLAYSLGEHGQLPRAFGRLNRRTLVSPQAIVERGADLERDRDHQLLRAPRGAVPREPLLVRRAARVHGGAAGRDQAARHRARPAAPVPLAAEREHSRQGDPAAGDRRRGAHVRSSGSTRWPRTPARATPARPGSPSGSSSTSSCGARTARG